MHVLDKKGRGLNRTQTSKIRIPATSDSAVDLTEKQTPRAEPETVGSIVQISRNGSLVLHVEAEDSVEVVLLRVDGRQLSELSPYFSQLLNTRFEEGISIAKRHDELLQSYTSIADVPSDDLPKIKIQGIGYTSKIKSIRSLLVDLMLVLHGRDLPSQRPPLVNLANLVIVADRFLVTDVLARTVAMKLLLGEKKYGGMDEETTRQKLMIGVLLHNAAWTLRCSAKMVLDGSLLWSDDEPPPAVVTSPNRALWWDLPGVIEEEIQTRRHAIFDTIQSLQDFHLGLFTEKGTRHCKLGYDTSPQCDSFQLGEFVKFLTRCGTLSFGSAPKLVKNRNIKALLDTLRQCPSYQLDPNHAHCGPRKSFITGLEHIERHLIDGFIGLCLDTRRKGSSFHSLWSDSDFSEAAPTRTDQEVFRCSCLDSHVAARQLFMPRLGHHWEFLLTPPSTLDQLGLRFGSMSYLK